MSTIIQQDATIYSLFISANCSTCFGWYLHSSWWAYITGSTVSGVIETVTATCRERDWILDTVDTVIPKSCRAVFGYKLYIVASCWIIVDTYYAMHGPLNIKILRKFVRSLQFWLKSEDNDNEHVTSRRLYNALHDFWLVEFSNSRLGISHVYNST